jgi:hypothetical protein
MTTTITPRPVADVQDDIRRYGEWLKLDCVRASGRWYAETEAKLAAAMAELKAAMHQARATVERAKVTTARVKAGADMAWLDAVQDIAPRGTRAGAR